MKIPASAISAALTRPTEIGRLLKAVNVAGANVRGLMHAMRDTPHARFVAETNKLAQQAREPFHPSQSENPK